MRLVSGFPAGALLTGALAFLAATANAASFQGLGFVDMTDPGSGASGVSADGSTVVGWSAVVFGEDEESYGLGGFRWTAATGMVGLGFPDGPPDDPLVEWASEAVAVSGDGSVIVGRSSGPSGPGSYRWTAATAFVGIDGEVQAVSADGRVVVGSAQSQEAGEAFRWTESGGLQSLGSLSPDFPGSGALGTSPDGSVVVGGSRTRTAKFGRSGGPRPVECRGSRGSESRTTCPTTAR